MITAIICTILLGTRTTTLHTVYRVIYCTHNDSNVHMNCEPQFGEQRNAYPHNHYSSIEYRTPCDNSPLFFRVGLTTTRHVLSIRNSRPFRSSHNLLLLHKFYYTQYLYTHFFFINDFILTILIISLFTRLYLTNFHTHDFISHILIDTYLYHIYLFTRNYQHEICLVAKTRYFRTIAGTTYHGIPE